MADNYFGVETRSRDIDASDGEMDIGLVGDEGLPPDVRRAVAGLVQDLRANKKMHFDNVVCRPEDGPNPNEYTCDMLVPSAEVETPQGRHQVKNIVVRVENADQLRFDATEINDTKVEEVEEGEELPQGFGSVGETADRKTLAITGERLDRDRMKDEGLM